MNTLYVGRTTLKVGLSAIAVAAVMGAFSLTGLTPLGAQPAMAQADAGHDDGGHDGGAGQGGSGQGQGGQNGQGGQGGGGHDDGGHEDGGHDAGGHEAGGGEGAGGQGGAGNGQGGQGETGQGSGGTGAGPETRPAWAGEGIPEVELGRLNVARSPEHVLDRAYDEALASLTPEMRDFYGLSLAEMQDQLVNNWDTLSFIDSPLQNLAMMQALLTGDSTPADLGMSNDSLSLASLMLGAASDKTVPISQDTVVAVTTILGIELTAQQMADLATSAEAIRQAILAGHG
ncbi:hypothetical protein [Nioella nitratireducens]|uniref:hypothetical protein n=1 Tax=Nioella nitratireducens TaxID=1287720 RepID=UPI0008FD59E4|nr:hypothetical protein [Nioella nitratireducens]